MSLNDSQAATAEAYRTAGNLGQAQSLCSEVLGRDPTHFAAFDCLFDVLLAKQDYVGVQRLCEWRLEQVPNCILTNIRYLLYLGATGQRDKAEQLLRRMEDAMGDSPYLLKEAKIIESHFFGKPGRTLALIENARQSGEVNPSWLDYFETMTLEDAGRIFEVRSRREQGLAEDPNDPDEHMALAELNFLTGRPWKVIRLSTRGRSLAPALAGRFRLLQVLACIAYCPLVWPAHAVLWIKACIIDRLPVALLLPLIFIAIAAGCVVGLALLWPVSLMAPDYYEAVKNILLGLNIIWMLVLIFALDVFDMKGGEGEKSIKLSSDY